MGSMGELMAAHLETLADYPLAQGKSFDISNITEEFAQKSHQ